MVNKGSANKLNQLNQNMVNMKSPDQNSQSDSMIFQKWARGV